jgi:hypothetical protein
MTSTRLTEYEGGAFSWDILLVILVWGYYDGTEGKFNDIKLTTALYMQ